MTDHDDLGRPATELRELRESPDDRFLHRIRGSIHRRLFATDTADFAFRIFFETMFDYLDLLMRTFLGATAPKSTDREQD